MERKPEVQHKREIVELDIKFPMPSKRQLWLSISSSILLAQEEHPKVKYIEQLNATHANYLRYIYPLGNVELYLHPSYRIQLCKLIYIGEVTADLQQRAQQLLQIQRIDTNSFVLGFCRFYDVAVHFYGMFVNQTYQLITGSVELDILKQNVGTLASTLRSILEIKQDTIVKSFSNFISIYFFEFKFLVLGEELETVNEFHEMPESPTLNARKLSFTTKIISRLPYRYSKEKYCLCESMMKDGNLYELDHEERVIRADAIEFSLIYIIRTLLEDEDNVEHRETLIQVLYILETPSPNNKKYRALDPKSWVEYKERNKIFYTTIYGIILEAIKGPVLHRHESVKQTYSGYYISFNDYKGFSIKYGEISIVSKQGEYYLMVRNSRPDQKQLLQKEVDIMFPGFINLHTHTKYSLQGNVNFGSMFRGRFQWRQAQFQGKYIVQLSRHIANKKQSQLEFKKYVKMYTQLQGLIGGTTTIFQQSKFDVDNTLPDIVRNTIVPKVTDKESFNITSNDIYVIWRNEKLKTDLMLAWSYDYTHFVQSVIEIEIQVLQLSESYRTNLHVHLAQGRSKYAITLCQFDNFCQDIICMEHFLRHLKTVMRDKTLNFQKKFQINCESKTEGVFGINIVSASSVDDRFSSYMSIKKHIRFVEENKIKTEIELSIHYYYKLEDGSKQKVEVVNIPHSELVQVYQIHTLRSNLLVIHANGMDPTSQLHQYIIKTYNVCFCISPYSNISLYGGVNDFNWKDLIVNPKYAHSMCISTDWSPTGKENLIEEIRFMLKKLKEVNFTIDHDLYKNILQMISINPGRIAKMPVGEIKDGFFPDFWLGKFPTSAIVQKGQIDPDKLIEYVFTEFPYQNDIKKIYSKGRLVYSNIQEQNLQEIVLKHQKPRYFYNPEGECDNRFQSYVARMRQIMIQNCKSPISLLFP